MATFRPSFSRLQFITSFASPSIASARDRTLAIFFLLEGGRKPKPPGEVTGVSRLAASPWKLTWSLGPSPSFPATTSTLFPYQHSLLLVFIQPINWRLLHSLSCSESPLQLYHRQRPVPSVVERPGLAFNDGHDASRPPLTPGCSHSCIGKALYVPTLVFAGHLFLQLT